jgi:hypothetical protein
VAGDQRTATADYTFAINNDGRISAANLNSSGVGSYLYNGFEQRVQKLVPATAGNDFFTIASATSLPKPMIPPGRASVTDSLNSALRRMIPPAPYRVSAGLRPRRHASGLRSFFNDRTCPVQGGCF